MKFISQQKAIGSLAEIRYEFRSEIRSRFEHRAKSCVTCETPGACCLDAHFVNVRVSRLEAEAINEALDGLSPEIKKAVRERTVNCIKAYKLDEALETETATYACPLFEPGIGCLVHETAKPLPCIAHACYESQSDLPPDEILDRAELAVYDLNIRTYGQVELPLPIPLAIRIKL